MDITSMKSLLELQALQNMNTSSDPNSTTSSSNSALFSELMGDLMNEQTTGNTGNPNHLGNINSLEQLLDTVQTTTPASTTNYISTFMLANSKNLVSLNKPIAASSVEEITAKIEQYTKDYTGKESFENFLSGAEKYRTEISKAAQKYELPEKLIAAVMKQESNFNASAVSSAGASGLMQLMPSTAKYLGVNDRFDPEQNIMGGAKYLRQMLDQFDNNLSTALAAYNAGPGNVRKYDGIPPFKETQNYVKKVLNYFNA